ncbi:MAG: hypothetical protein LBE27_02465 [Deltaproteobacteria bacterium]|jgi:hypothetical protein|nr:hypothetical protein [Deltaproteobacteria bacterium]
MTKKITTVFASLVFLFATALMLNIATPAQAQLPGLDALNIGKVLPTLTETDFTNFIDLYPTFLKDPAAAFKTLATKGVDIEHFQGVITKIVTNVHGLTSPDALNALKSQFGDSGILNAAEKILFDKYKDKLVGLVTSAIAQ